MKRYPVEKLPIDKIKAALDSGTEAVMIDTTTVEKKEVEEE